MAQAPFEALLRESCAEGFDHVRRLIAHWEDGSNRFERLGEKLFGAFHEDALIGVGGLNIDPYAGDPAIGRVRHLYVLPNHRRHGVAARKCSRCQRGVSPLFTAALAGGERRRRGVLRSVRI